MGALDDEEGAVLAQDADTADELSTTALTLCIVAGAVVLCALCCVVRCAVVKRRGGASSQVGGAGTRKPMQPVSAESYPFYAMTVKDLLALKEWRPHQHLLADNKLVNLTENPAAAEGREVIFVSHQWTAFDHPDPACSQLQALQRVLHNLLAGGLEVRTNVMLEAVYGIKVITPGAEWKAMLPESLIWIDYACMPQPSAEDTPAAPAAGSKAKVQDHRLLKGTSESKQRVIEQLTLAVESIPSYVERCSQMWVLVPAIEHKDMKDTTCDLYSWRSRGWCRMEFAASKLARGDDMPIVVIESASTLYYLNPCDTVRLCAAQGDFSVPTDVSKVNDVLGKMHDAKVQDYIDEGDYELARGLIIFRPNFAPVESTAAKIEKDQAKAAAAEEKAAAKAVAAAAKLEEKERQQAEQQAARDAPAPAPLPQVVNVQQAPPSAPREGFVHSSAHLEVDPGKDDETGHHPMLIIPHLDDSEIDENKVITKHFLSTPTQAQAQVDADPLASLKNRMHWRDEATEEKWMAGNGWSLLHMAAGMDDLPAVNHLLGQLGPKTLKEIRAASAVNSASKSLLSKVINPFKKNTPLRQQPFGQHIGTSFEGLTPLSAAATWASPELVQALLNAGAVATMEAACGHLSCHCTGAVMGAKLDNLAVLIKHDPTLAVKANDMQYTALHYTCERSGLQTKDMLKLLISKGADLNAVDSTGKTPIHTLCNKAEILDKDPEVLDILKKAGANIEAPLGSLGGMMVKIKPVATLAGSLGVQQMEGYVRLFDDLDAHKGQTVLQKSAEIGHSRQMKVLMSAGAVVPEGTDRVQEGLKQTRGDTAAPALVQRALDDNAKEKK